MHISKFLLQFRPGKYVICMYMNKKTDSGKNLESVAV